MVGSDRNGSLSLRAVLPRWYLIGAIVALVVVIVVSSISGGYGAGAAVAAFWAPLICTVIAERRSDRTMRPRTAQGSRESRWWEPVTAAGFTVLAIGTALAAGNIWPTLRPGPLLAGLILLAVGGAFFVILLRVRPSR